MKKGRKPVVGTQASFWKNSSGREVWRDYEELVDFYRDFRNVPENVSLRRAQEIADTIEFLRKLVPSVNFEELH